MSSSHPEWAAHLVEDRLGLTTITALLAVITTLSLGEQRGLSCLVLGDLVLSVCERSVFVSRAGNRGLLTLLAVLALAVGSAGLGYVDLKGVSLCAKPMYVI